jgi:hypothetical protein
MVRTGRPRRTRRRVWSEIGVSAGVLLVPPLLISGAVYGLLPAHDDGAARGSALAALESLPADFNSRSAIDTGLEPSSALAAWASPDTNALVAAKPATPAATEPAAAAIAAAVAAKPAVTTAANKPTAAKRNAPPAKPAVAAPTKVTTPEPTTFALASDHSELVGKEVTRAGALGPVPVQVTVVVAPNAAEAEDRQPVSLAAPPPAIAALPPAPADAPSATTAARSAEPPREHHFGTQHGTGPHFRHLARHNRARPEASEEHTTQQRPAEPPQHDFSLRNLFQQQQQGGGGRQKSAVRG